MMAFFQEYINYILFMPDMDKGLSLLVYSMASLLFPIIPFSIYIIYIVRKALIEKRFPLSGTIIIFDKIKLHGEKEVMSAYMILFLAILLLTITTAAIYYILFVFPEAFMFNEQLACDRRWLPNKQPLIIADLSIIFS